MTEPRGRDSAPGGHLSGTPDEHRQQIRALRGALGLTQEQLAQRLHVSFVTVNRWETGRRAPSGRSRRRLEALAASAATPKARESVVGPNLLLVPPTPFIGREAELRELEAMLLVSRHLTLTGPGGSGKTRLALELVRRSSEQDGAVTLIALDAVVDPELLPTVISAALGLRDAVGVTPLDQVIDHLVAKPHLLVLDNCEHVAEATARFLVAALTAAPRLRVLATSRTVLNVVGEQVWAVPPMSLPPPGSGPSEVCGSDAGRLFVDRARSRRAGFAVDDTNAAAIMTICQLLDGLPLALELAAAWSAVLAPGELATRLLDNLSLLDVDGKGRGRHRTLRATVQWSDTLLGAGERRLLLQLSVFAGRFTLADAAAVCAVADDEDIVVLLRRLVDSSWIVAADGTDTTYGLLNTLRSYARGLLEHSGQVESVRRRHAESFAAMAEASEAALTGPGEYLWRQRMERATADLEAALRWARDCHEPDLCFRLVASLWRWWYTTGRIVEGRAWAEAALNRSRSVSPLLRARVLYTSAILASENGDYATAMTHGQAARRQFEVSGDHGGAARSSTVLGNIARFAGDADAARTYLADAVASQRTAGDDWGIAVALQNLASLAIDQADLRGGRLLVEESLTLKRRAGDQRSLGYGLVNLSDLLLREHVPDKAIVALQEAASIAAALGDLRLAGFVDHNLGDVASSVGDPTGAARKYRDALSAFREVDDRRDVALALCSLGRALLKVGERTEGTLVLRQSKSLAAELGDELRLSEVRAALSAVSLPQTADNLPDGLTPRQTQVLSLVAAGLTNRIIAERLLISSGTVERHLATIYTKLDVHNRVGATRYALTRGLSVLTPEVAEEGFVTSS